MTRNCSNIRTTLIASALFAATFVLTSACDVSNVPRSAAGDAEVAILGIQSGHYFSAPGAAMPAGVDMIKPGMSGDEVLQILTPRYKYEPLEWRTKEEPGFDYFTYVENGRTKYIEVNYDPIVVAFVRYGFSEPAPVF